MKRSNLLVPLFLVALAPVSASAQEAADTFQLDEVVVTATRLATPRRAVPAAVTVLHGEELRAQGIHFVAEALRQVPGASIVRTGSYGGLTAAFVRGGESDYVQVLVDGVVVNDPGGAVDLGQLTLDDVDRIEVVRGPVSVLYGSDAVTGVIQIFTTRGSGAPRVQASADYGVAPRRNGELSVCPGYPRTPCPSSADLGSYDMRSFDATLSGGADLLSWSVGASDFATDGAYAFNNRYTNRSVDGRLGLDGEAGDAAFTARFTDALFHYPTDGAGRLDDRNIFRSSESLALGLEAGRFFGSRVEGRAALALHQGDYETVDDPDSSSDPNSSTSDIAIDRRKATVWGNLHLGSTIATLGGEVEKQHGTDDFDSQSSFGPFASSSENERSNKALFAQVATAPGARVAVTVGARTEDNDRFGNFLTWRAGATARLSPTTRARVSAGTAFKEPTFFENYAQGFTMGNEALEPEESRSWEIGLDQELLDGRGEIAATWFDQRFRNLIQYNGAAAPGTPNYVNVGEALSRGLEVEARLAARGGASLSGSWVHLTTEVLDDGLGTDALFQEGEPLIRRAPDRVNLMGTTPFADRFRAGAGVTWVGSHQDLDFLDDFSGDRVELDSYTLVDVFGEARLAGGTGRDLSLRVRVDNLFDQEYQEVVNFPAPGRTLSVSVRAGIGL